MLVSTIIEGCGWVKIQAAPTPIAITTSTSIPISPPTSTITLTATLTPLPTPTPLQFIPEQLIFPFDVNEVISKLPKGANHIFIYHYTHRLRDDPCGGHLGDLLVPLSLSLTNVKAPGYNAENHTYTGYSYRVIQPYSGIVKKMWGTQGGDDLGITFLIGERGGMEYYLSMFHHDRYADPNLRIGDFVSAGEILGYEEKGNNFGNDNAPYIEGKVHFVLENVPHGQNMPDFIDTIPETSLDISLLLLPETILQTTAIGLPLLVRYDGYNSCNMTGNEAEKHAESLLINAGFCKSSNFATYCGTNSRYEGLQVSITPVDYRTIELKQDK
jgi:hypothetical protein